MLNHTFIETIEYIVVVSFKCIKGAFMVDTDINLASCKDITVRAEVEAEPELMVAAPTKVIEKHYNELVQWDTTDPNYASDEAGNEYLMYYEDSPTKKGWLLMDWEFLGTFHSREMAEDAVNTIAEILKYGYIILDDILDHYLIFDHLVKKFWVRTTRYNYNRYVVSATLD